MQNVVARAKYTPISEVLKDAPKMDKAALLELAEAVVSYDPAEFLRGRDEFDDCADIQLFLQISEFAEELRQDNDFLYKLFFLQIKHYDMFDIWKKDMYGFSEALDRNNLLTYPEHREFIMRVNAFPVQRKEGGQLVDDPDMQFFFPRKMFGLRAISGDFGNDREFLLSFANHDQTVTEHASQELRDDKDFVLSCVSNYGSNLYDLESDLTDDRDVMWTAVFGPKKYEQRARQYGGERELGKRIGSKETIQYAGGRINRDKEFLFNVLMELERRYFWSGRSRPDPSSIPYDELKAMYFGHPSVLFREVGKYNEYDSTMDNRTVHESLIDHWWRYSYRGKLKQRYPHYRDFLRKMLLKKLKALGAPGYVPRKRQRTKLRF